MIQIGVQVILDRETMKGQSMDSKKLTNAALLVIDMQNGFCHEDSQMGRSVGVSSQQKVASRLADFLPWVREKNIPIFWSQQIHFHNDQTRANRIFKDHSQKQGFLPCLEGTFETDFYPPVQKLMKPADQIITKHRASVFFDTNFATRLRMLGIQQLIVTGCNTEFCVAHTIRDAYARDFEILVLSDLVAGIKPEYHELCLKMFSDYFAIITDSKSLRQAPTPQKIESLYL